MTFAGMPRGKERADVIAFLNTQSDKPVELPKQAAAPAAEKQAARPGRWRGEAGARAGRRTALIAHRGSTSWPARDRDGQRPAHAELMFDTVRPSPENRHNRLSIVAYFTDRLEHSHAPHPPSLLRTGAAALAAPAVALDGLARPPAVLAQEAAGAARGSTACRCSAT